MPSRVPCLSIPPPECDTTRYPAFLSVFSSFLLSTKPGRAQVFASREALDKYLNGRIKAHAHYFTEISPAIPKEYADCFKVNGCLLPGYTIEGEEPAKAAALPTQEEAAQPPQTAATPERREPVNEVFSIFLDNRAEAQTGGPHGYWLSLPTSAELEIVFFHNSLI